MNMFLEPKRNKAALGIFITLNCVLVCLICLPLLRAILTAPTVYDSTGQHFSDTSVHIFIILSNLCIFISYLALPVIILGLVLKAFKQLSAWIAIGVFSLLVLAFFIDTQVYLLFHFHLSPVHIRFFLHQEMAAVLSLSKMEGLIIILGALFIVLLEYALLLISAKLLRWAKYPKYFCCLWIFCFCYSVQLLLTTINHQNNIFSQHLSALPLALQAFKSIVNDKQHYFLTRYNENIYQLNQQGKFTYPKVPLRCSPSKRLPNIIFVTIDSLRFDIVTDEFMPNMSRFGESFVSFKQHYSGGNSTQPGLFSLFYALPSNYWYAALEHQKSPILLDLLKKYGYQRKVIWSTNMRHPRVAETLYLGIQPLRMDAAPGDDALAWDAYSTREAIDFIKQEKGTSPYFLQVFYHSLHAFCRTEGYTTYFSPSEKVCNRMNLDNSLDPTKLKNRYLNVVKTLDANLAQLFDLLSQPGVMDNSIIIITSDHGQEFNDNKQNYWGHASNYSKHQLAVPFLIRWPNRKLQKYYSHLTTHYDVVPTLLQDVLNCQNDPADYSIGYKLFDSRERYPFIAGSYADMAVLDKHKNTVFKTSGEVVVFDKQQQRLTKTIDQKAQKYYLSQTLRFTRVRPKGNSTP